MTHEETSTALALTGGFSSAQVDLIKSQIAPDASDDQLALFLEVCRGTGLNPFMRQIYAVFRNEKKGDRWVKRMTIQTGIDGYRLLAARTGELAGIDDAVYDSDDGEHPNRATVTVYRFARHSSTNRMAFTATARYKEYVQTTKDGDPTSMWLRMPYLMLAKCAEALALRKAFPAELSGIYTGDEMGQADNPEPPIPTPPKTPTPLRPGLSKLHLSADVPAVEDDNDDGDVIDDAGEPWPFIRDVDFRQALNKAHIRTVDAVQQFVERVTHKPFAEARRADRTVCMEQAIEEAKQPVPASLEGLPVGKRGQ